MPKKSPATRIVQKSAREITPATSVDLGRLRAAMKRTVATGDIPERRRFRRLHRDADGKLPARKSVIRDAVARELRRRNLTVYRLWQLAREHYPHLSQAAVHEFLKGQRQLELPSVEALLTAVNLRIVRNKPAKRGLTRRESKQSARKRL
jgi:hypothetical protein